MSLKFLILSDLIARIVGPLLRADPSCLPVNYHSAPEASELSSQGFFRRFGIDHPLAGQGLLVEQLLFPIGG